MAAVRVSLAWFGTRKSLTAEQKAEAAEPFNAEAKFISAGKKLLDTTHPAYKAVTAVRGKVQAYWKAMSLPYPEPGIRLIRQDKIDDFAAKMAEFQEELVEAVEALDRRYHELKATARQRLGSLYNSADYPESLRGLFSIEFDFPSVEPPDYLQQLNPELYQQECQRVQSRFDEAVRLPPLQLARVDRRLAGPTVVGRAVLQPPSLGLLRAKEKCLRGAVQEWLEHLLGPRPQRDLLPAPSPAAFVVGRLVNPDIARGVDVARPHQHQLAGPHAAQPLYLEHGGHDRADEGQHEGHVEVGYRAYGLGFAGGGSAEGQASYRLEAVVNGRRNQLLGHRPLEHPLDLADPLVDHATGKPRFDHLVADNFELLGAEVGCRDVPVEMANRSQGCPDRVDLPGWGTAFQIMGLGELPVRKDQLIDRQGRTLRCLASGRDGSRATVRVQFRDQAGVILSAFGGPVLAEIPVLTVDDDASLAGRSVKPIGGDKKTPASHVQLLSPGKVVVLPLFSGLASRTADRRQVS
jgi:hypothetical protein